MMKKLICLMLALITVLMVFTSCSNNEDAASVITDEASRSTTSLNMWMITESALVAQASERYRSGWNPDKLTDEQKAEFEGWPAEERDALTQFAAISKAINKLTKAKYKTQLNLVMLTEDEYYAKLEAAYVAREAEVKIEQTTKKEETETEESTVINEHGIPELKYPEISPNQIDIMFIGSFEKYREYADKSMLVALDAHLQDSAIQLSYFLNQIYVEAAKYNGVVSAIPTNGAIGEYTYLCVKTTELEKYGYNVSDFSKLSIYDNRFYEFLELVHSQQEKTGIYPIYTNSADGKLDLGTVHYWNFDIDSIPGNCILNENVFSLYGGVYDNVNENGTLVTRGDSIRFANLLANQTFMNNYLGRKIEYENAGYVTTDTEVETATCVVTGGWELQEQYRQKGYQILMMENPRATTASVFDSMFAVSELSNEDTRAMEIITYLNTDVEVRNLLQYGIENVNYTLNTVERMKDGMPVEYYYVTENDNNLYKMDINKTGNVFIAYPTSEQGIDELEWGKMQNLDATMYPTLGMYCNQKTYELETQSIRVINAISPYIEKKLNALTLVGEGDNAVNEAHVWFNTFNTTGNMARELLIFIGEEVSYVNDKGETKVLTEADLAAALTGFVVPFKETDKKQSPAGMYTNWLDMLK